MNGTCKHCNTPYSAPKHCCKETKEGYYMKCSDCHKPIKMEEGK